MKKMNQILLATFLLGILLTGIGCGVAILEYSSFEYEGEKIIGQGQETTKTLECQIPTGKKAKKTLISNCQEQHMKLVEDKKVPKGMVYYDVSYNPDYVEPILSYESYEEDEPLDYEGQLHLWSNDQKDDFVIFMEEKDQILQDLKDHKVSSYKLETWKKVTIRVHPETIKYIKIM